MGCILLLVSNEDEGKYSIVRYIRYSKISCGVTSKNCTQESYKFSISQGDNKGTCL